VSVDIYFWAACCYNFISLQGPGHRVFRREREGEGITGMTDREKNDRGSEYEVDEYVRVIPGREQVFRTILLIQAGALSIALLWGWLRRIDWWHTIRFDGSLAWGLVLGILLALANHLIYRLLGKHPLTHMEWVLNDLMFPLFRNARPGDIILFSALSGFCEEALFRGAMQEEWGIIISNLVFGALHTGDRRLIFTGFITSLMGLVLGYSLLLTGNLAVPMLAHGVNNICGLVFLRCFFTPGNRPGGG